MTGPRTLPDFPTLYREARERVAALVRAADPGQLARVVPACPEWTVADTVAHLAAVAVETTDGTLTGIPDEAHTAAQVRARCGLPPEDVLAEWERAGPAVERALTARAVPVEIVHDVVTHEADLRGALGAPRVPEPAWRALLDLFLRHLDRLAGFGTLTVHVDGARHTVGSGPPEAELVVDPYEFWRSQLGRRSRAQMAAWQWSGDPTPYLRAIPLFGPSETDLHEP